MKIPSWIVAGVLLISGGCTACDDRTLPEPLPEDAAERFAQAVCDAEVECECGLHASPAECEAQMASAFEAIVDRGVTLDEGCFDEFLKSPIFSACTEGGSGAPSCVAMVGRADIGEPCVWWNMFTMLPGGTCRDGLQCGLAGVCQDPANPAPIDNDLGDPCNPEFHSCGLLYCMDETSTCAERKAVGESCTEPDECDLGAYCEGLSANAGACALQVQLGQPCSPDDALACFDSWCEPASNSCVESKPFVCVNQPVG